MDLVAGDPAARRLRGAEGQLHQHLGGLQARLWGPPGTRGSSLHSRGGGIEHFKAQCSYHVFWAIKEE